MVINIVIREHKIVMIRLTHFLFCRNYLFQIGLMGVFKKKLPNCYEFLNTTKLRRLQESHFEILSQTDCKLQEILLHQLNIIMSFYLTRQKSGTCIHREKLLCSHKMKFEKVKRVTYHLAFYSLLFSPSRAKQISIVC